MAKQLTLITGQVIPTALHTEMQQSYLEYAMSVIVGRALPDVRDGLKPVHRRILYAMHELGLTPDRPYRKCARVVGDVLGKYHPHGDQSVYDALVRMVQEFSSRYPLLGGHGNFGSVDNDPPAAMRYTETRLAAIGHEGMLADVSEATVDFVSNFDNSQQEPTVLPAQLPFLLLNGCSGIAVGMATNVPPHNLGELVDGLIALIDKPDLTDEKLIELIPGPDFPTGGEIINSDGIIDAYTKGRGSIPMRGIANFEEITVGKNKRTKTAIVVTELPFAVNKSAWIEKMADLVNAGKLEGITEIRDESDRTGIRVVIELKKEVSPPLMLQQIYQQTDLQTNFGAIFLCIVNGQPRQLTLKQVLQEFLNFRETTLTRQYTEELTQLQRRSHLVEGLLLALENIDKVIDILRNSPDGTTAKNQFANELKLSDAQADAILGMPMRRLTGLERQKLQDEYGELKTKIEEIEKLLGDRKELLKFLKKELKNLKKKYADPRRTRIIGQPTKIEIKEVESEIPKEKTRKKAVTQEPTETAASYQIPIELAEDTVVEFTNKQYVRRLAPKNWEKQQQKNGEPNPNSSKLEKVDDFTQKVQFTSTDQTLIILTRAGKAYPLNIRDIPQISSNREKGTPLISLLSPSASKDSEGRTLAEIMTDCLILSEKTDFTDLIMLSQQGKIKRLPLTELTDITNRGITVIKLKENDELRYASLAKPQEQVILATSGGRVLRFDIDDVQLPAMGRAAQGSQATRLRKNENLVGCATIQQSGELLLISEFGWGKRIDSASVRLTMRGEIGTQAFHFANDKDALISVLPALPNTEVKILTTNQRLLRLSIQEIALCRKDALGDRLAILAEGEKVAKVVIG